MRKAVFVVLLASFAVTPLFAAQKATVKVLNKSKWEIHHLYLSPSDVEKWGPDQLGDETLATGDSLTLTNIDCDKYDIRVVDEDGDECVIEAQKLCNDVSIWKITDEELLACESETEDE